MKSKEKVKGGDNRARGIHKPKVMTVAEGSLQSRAPGYVMPGGADTLFPKANLGSMQADLNRGTRNGVGTQHGAWSARQQAQRMQARGEQDRLGQIQQSNGMEQQQSAGSLQSSSGNSGSRQSGLEAAPQDGADQSASDYASKPSRKAPRS
ncbi:hypothetical protein [Telluria aromaticivorans]|uniref:Uncharacterized protein n=1 Tax=Telluria aromaticivorans TaxID=2725995 RepID=A0A7Y2P224_9BURK|nr:hypothetical protein [Telluria aromaticivorans]NNG25869.1 hypothetical protein [Telluria aromaticivorans]